jgi:transcriptional regulator with XRE-family HTH domain
VFYDKFKLLCDEKGVSPKRAVTEMGMSNSLATKWKNTGATPNGATLGKIADYFGVSVEYLLGTETKKEPAPTNGNGLSEEVIQIARDLEAAAPEVRNMVKAVLEKSYKPEVGVKVIDVLCPLSGRVEQIHQPYYVYNGKRLPEKNNGCDQCYKCPECELCQMRVMRTVMEGEE